MRAKFNTYIQAENEQGEPRIFEIGALKINDLMRYANTCGVLLTKNQAYIADGNKSIAVGNRQAMIIKNSGKFLDAGIYEFGGFIHNPKFCFERENN
jgi:hypothetical protein